MEQGVPVGTRAGWAAGARQDIIARNGTTRARVRTPLWPETVAAVKNIIEVYASNARKHERVGEWIERVGWERFFNLTGIPFTDKHIDDFDLATETFRSSTQFKWR